MVIPWIDGDSTISQMDSDSTVIFIYLQRDQTNSKKKGGVYGDVYFFDLLEDFTLA